VYLLILCLFCVFVNCFVLLVIAVTPFRSYFVWLIFGVLGILLLRFLFILCRVLLLFTVCSFGVVLLCSVGGVGILWFVELFCLLSVGSGLVFCLIGVWVLHCPARCFVV